MSIRQKIAERAKQLGLDYNALARLTGLPRGTIYRYLHGKGQNARDLTSGRLDLLLDALGLELAPAGEAAPSAPARAPAPEPPATTTGRMTLLHGDCREKLRELADQSVDAVITDPIYPGFNWEYGRITEPQWHALMREVMPELRRVLKPHGSAVVIIQPNFRQLGAMRLWPWEFVVWAAKEWNLVQDVYWWAVDAMPSAGTTRKAGLLRQSVKLCVWLGAPDCFRDQEAVMWQPSDVAMAERRSDRAMGEAKVNGSLRSRIETLVKERGASTPFNLLPISTQPRGSGGHPTPTSYKLVQWWCRYILPPDGVLLDPFCGSGSVLEAGLETGAAEVIGIDQREDYLATARGRMPETVRH